MIRLTSHRQSDSGFGLGLFWGRGYLGAAVQLFRRLFCFHFETAPYEWICPECGLRFVSNFSTCPATSCEHEGVLWRK